VITPATVTGAIASPRPAPFDGPLRDLVHGGDNGSARKVAAARGQGR
jgi:hypothetical protein